MCDKWLRNTSIAQVGQVVDDPSCADIINTSRARLRTRCHSVKIEKFCRAEWQVVSRGLRSGLLPRCAQLTPVTEIGWRQLSTSWDLASRTCKVLLSLLRAEWENRRRVARYLIQGTKQAWWLNSCDGCDAFYGFIVDTRVLVFSLMLWTRV